MSSLKTKYEERKRRVQEDTQPIESSVLENETDSIEDLIVDVAEIEEKPKQSLKEKLLKTFVQQDDPIEPEKRRGRKASTKQQENVLVTVMPTVIASFITTYVTMLLPDEYKVCAPSQEEMYHILAPIMSIIGRRVEIIGKASQDAIDIANTLIASLTFGTRAYITYVEINRYKQKSTTETEASRVNRNSTSSNEKKQDSISGEFGNANYHNGYQNSSNREAETIARMFERDKQGRIGLGLLPREV